MAGTSSARVRDDLARLVHRGGEIVEFTPGASRVLGRAVPFDGLCMLTLDPATLLPTGEVVENGLSPVATAHMSEIELCADDMERPARARVRGSALVDDRAARIAGPHELAPLIADAYELTDRERSVTQLVARGLPTDVIARRLYLSPWTVQDYLKSIFEKVGVSTRGELVARLFFEHYAPRLNERSQTGRHDGPHM